MPPAHYKKIARSVVSDTITTDSIDTVIKTKGHLHLTTNEHGEPGICVSVKSLRYLLDLAEDRAEEADRADYDCYVLRFPLEISPDLRDDIKSMLAANFALTAHD